MKLSFAKATNIVEYVLYECDLEDLKQIEDLIKQEIKKHKTGTKKMEKIS
jgi:hypothetical protein